MSREAFLKILLATALGTVWGATLVAASPKAVVQGVRQTNAAERTRIVIDLDRKPSFDIRPFSDPSRIAINIRGADASSAVRPFEIARGAVRGVRINRLSWGAQVVLDLRDEATWRDFYLAAVDEMPHRIVVDVEPATMPRSSASASPKRRDWIVAIDAGHGGSDPGAIAKGKIVEKRAALDIARRVALVINAMDGFTAVLTRDRDVFISLPERTRIAQKKNADIFVSVHLNSAPQRSARGAEVYFLSPGGAKRTANRFLSNTRRAARELGVEGASSPDIVHMLVDVNQQSMMERSALLAEDILVAIGRKSGLPPTRSIKQRAFAVLKSIKMPSVMVETGFLTNSRDAAILQSDKGRDRMARAIADGIATFFDKHAPPPNETGRIIVHRVREGETLWRISRQYKTSVASIQEANRMGKSKLIRAGQELVIREGYATN